MFREKTFRLCSFSDLMINHRSIRFHRSYNSLWHLVQAKGPFLFLMISKSRLPAYFKPDLSMWSYTLTARFRYFPLHQWLKFKLLRSTSHCTLTHNMLIFLLHQQMKMKLPTGFPSPNGILSLLTLEILSSCWVIFPVRDIPCELLGAYKMAWNGTQKILTLLLDLVGLKNHL